MRWWMVRVVRRVAGAALLASAAGCAAVHRPSTTVTALADRLPALEAREQAIRDTVVARLARRVTARGDRTLDILMLSGGGQNGAFGAGFLAGWMARGDLPRFDAVTGISTGALQAPFALQGTAAAIDSLRALYRRAAKSFAPTLDWWFWLRRTGGVVNTTRFDRTLAATVGPTLAAAMATEVAADRQLLVATTNYDLGRWTTWPLSDLMVSGDSGLVTSRRVLKAATAIPGIFPPVVIDGDVHGDGGVVSNVLPALDLAGYQQLGALTRARDAGLTVRVWVIMNIWTDIAPEVINPASRRQISSRANLMLFWTHQPPALEALAATGAAAQAAVPGLRVEVRVARIPSAVALHPDANTLFKSSFMATLDSLGYARGRSASPWDAGPSVTSTRAR